MASRRDRLLDDMAKVDLSSEERLNAIWLYYCQYKRLERLLRPVGPRAYDWDDKRVKAGIRFLDELIEAGAKVAPSAPARISGRKQLKSLRDRVYRYWARDTIARAKRLRRRRRRGTLTL